MLIIYIAALLGIFRARKRKFWVWLGILFVWTFGAQFLFAGGGTLENLTGDGLITRQIRIATDDGAGMGLFAMVFIFVYWSGVIWIIRRLYLASRWTENENLQRESVATEPVSVGRKFIEASVLTAVAAVYVYFAFIVPRMATDEPSSVTVSRTAEGEASDPVARDLLQVAEEISRQAPKKIDPITKLVGVSAEGRTLTYHYELSRRDGTDEQLRLFVHKNAVTATCNNADMRANMKDYGITYRYSYVMPNADAPIDVDATYQECMSLGLGR